MRLKALTPVLSISILIFCSCGVQESESRLMPVTTDSELAMQFYEAGILAYDQIKYKQAYYSLQMAVETDPDFFMAHFWLFFMSQKSGDGSAEKALKVDAALCDGELELQKALKYLSSGQMEKAVEHMQAAIDLYPGDPQVHKVLYLLQFHYLHDVDAAVLTLKRAIAEVPDYDLAYNQLGYALMDLEDFEGAEKAFDNYLRLSPNIANPYDSKGDYYMNLEHYKEAYDSYMKAYEMDSGFSVSKKKAGKALQLMEE